MLHGNIREIKERVNKKIRKIIWWFVALIALTIILYFVGKFCAFLSTVVKMCLFLSAITITIVTAVIFGCIVGFSAVIRMLDRILKEE